MHIDIYVTAMATSERAAALSRGMQLSLMSARVVVLSEVFIQAVMTPTSY